MNQRYPIYLTEQSPQHGRWALLLTPGPTNIPSSPTLHSCTRPAPRCCLNTAQAPASAWRHRTPFPVLALVQIPQHPCITSSLPLGPCQGASWPHYNRSTFVFITVPCGFFIFSPNSHTIDVLLICKRFPTPTRMYFQIGAYRISRV